LVARDLRVAERVSFLALTVSIRVAVDAVDVVAAVEPVAGPGIAVAGVDAPALEEHNADVHPAASRRDDARAKPVGVERVELVEVEAGLPIQRRSGTRTRVGPRFV